MRELFRYHPRIGHTFIPGLRARVEHEAGGYLVAVNGQGFRCGHEFRTAKPSGGFRVILCGDSFTAGDGVSNQRRYGDLLEQRLPGLELFNLGLPGTGTDQHLLAFEEVTRTMEYDLVVVAVQVENIRRVNSRYRETRNMDGETVVRAKPYFIRDGAGELTLCHVPVPRLPLDPAELDDATLEQVDRGGSFATLRGVVNRLGGPVKELAQRLSRYQPVPGYDQADHPHWLLLRDILTRLIRASQAPVVLFPIPLYQYVEGSSSSRACQARFAELHRPPGVTVVDPLPHLLTFPPATRRAFRFPQDVHPTPLYHRVLADCLEPALRARMGLPAAAGGSGP
ncbi:MAG: SGNH/GDSL hydrolase family protein [Magnetococcales bacterium]|nr:SGNH/GDSL hydrolase family protein [Magnetococcales bacterium]